MPNKPTKKWFDSMYDKIKSGNPSYSDEQIRKTVGDIFFNKLSPSEKEKAMKHGSHLLNAICILSQNDKLRIDKRQDG